MQKLTEDGRCRGCGHKPTTIYVNDNGDVMAYCPLCNLWEIVR